MMVDVFLAFACGLLCGTAIGWLNGWLYGQKEADERASFLEEVDALRYPHEDFLPNRGRGRYGD